MTTTPWEDPVDASTRFALSSLVGNTVLIAVGGCHPQWQTSRRLTPAVRANIAVLSGPQAGDEHVDVLIFNAGPVRQLRGCVGKAILAYVIADPNSAMGAVVLEAVDDATKEYASKWNAARPGRVEEMIKTAMEFYSIEETRRQAAPPQAAGYQPAYQQPAYQPPRQMPSAPPPLPPPPPSTFDSPPF